MNQDKKANQETQDNQENTNCKCGKPAAVFQLSLFGQVTVFCWECHSAQGDESDIEPGYERDERNFFYGSTNQGNTRESGRSTKQIALFCGV